MKLLTYLLLSIVSVHAATMHVYNKSGGPIRVSIRALDFGKAVGLPFYFLGTGGRGYDPYYDVAKPIDPGQSAWFDSGLTPIEKIYFYIPGREAVVSRSCTTIGNGPRTCQDHVAPIPVIFNANIGTLQVEQKVEYYNPEKIRKL